MPSTWSTPPTSLPEPQEVYLNVSKVWAEGTEDGAAITGTVTVISNGRSPRDALDEFLNTLTLAGWQVNVATARQTVTRTFTPDPDPVVDSAPQ